MCVYLTFSTFKIFNTHVDGAYNNIYLRCRHQLRHHSIEQLSFFLIRKKLINTLTRLDSGLRLILINFNDLYNLHQQLYIDDKNINLLCKTEHLYFVRLSR